MMNRWFMNPVMKLLAISFLAAARNGCGSAWVILPKYPAPYSYPHYKEVTESEVAINDAAIKTYLLQSRRWLRAKLAVESRPDPSLTPATTGL